MSASIHQFSPAVTGSLNISPKIVSPRLLNNQPTVHTHSVDNIQLEGSQSTCLQIMKDSNELKQTNPSIFVSRDQISVPINPAPFKIIIETRDGVIRTTLDILIKYKIMKSDEGLSPGLRDGESIWLDFRSSEVNDFLDILAGRKRELRSTEHIDAIAKELKVDLKMLDEEYNKIADSIREMIMIKIYDLFPAGKITKYNERLILYSPRLNLKTALDSNIREQLKKYTSNIRKYIWERVNSTRIPLRDMNGPVNNVSLRTDMNFTEYQLILHKNNLISCLGNHIL